MYGIIGTRVLPADKPELNNRGGNHGSWNSVVAVRSSNSDHHSSRSLPSLTDGGGGLSFVTVIVFLVLWRYGACRLSLSEDWDRGKVILGTSVDLNQ
jgi:hypothetical protein